MKIIGSWQNIVIFLAKQFFFYKIFHFCFAPNKTTDNKKFDNVQKVHTKLVYIVVDNIIIDTRNFGIKKRCSVLITVGTIGGESPQR